MLSTYNPKDLEARMMSSLEPMQGFHHHSEIELNYVLKGGATYLYHWEHRTITENQLVAFWGTSPHSLIATQLGTVMAWITIPLSWILHWPMNPAIRQALLEGEWCVPTGNAMRYPVADWVEEIESKNISEALILELQACFLRLGKSIPHETTKPTELPDLSATGWYHIEKMARFMSEHFTEDIRISEIAAAARLHPKYAMQLFHKHCGVTIRDYLERHRMTHSQMLLIMTSNKIVDIAQASGFNTLSTFYDRFKKFTQSSPQAFRERYRKMQPI